MSSLEYTLERGPWWTVLYASGSAVHIHCAQLATVALGMDL